jgi:hypothetical protein
MKGYFKSEEALLQAIIDIDGDCIKADWCIMCPFAEKCIGRAITEARLLPKEDRARLAYEKLFNELMEKELEDRE